MTRVFPYLVQALFALNETFLISDEDAPATINGYEKRPCDFADAIARILGQPGGGSEQLAASVDALRMLFRASVDLTEGGYRPRFTVPGS